MLRKTIRKRKRKIKPRRKIGKRTRSGLNSFQTTLKMKSSQIKRNLRKTKKTGKRRKRKTKRMLKRAKSVKILRSAIRTRASLDSTIG